MTDFTLTRKPVQDLRIDLELDLLTPMVGGGAVARMVDRDQPVNGKTVRGHLRFWWRATRSGRYGADGLMAMQRDEAWLFGTAATFTDDERAQGLGPSRVQVTVAEQRPGRMDTYVRKGNLVPEYAAFPLPGDIKKGTSDARLLTSLRFRVIVHVPVRLIAGGRLDQATVEADVRAALWAWITFGGVGARTRRGFGALRDVGNEPTPEQIRAHLRRHVLTGVAPGGVPHLSDKAGDTVLLDGYPTAHDAWFDAIETYRNFRQARRGQASHPGRSYWPEPDEIRRLTGAASPAHMTPQTGVRKFPRAAFGLPIVFQFRKDGPRQGEPTGKISLEGQTDRLASPLILRPGAGGLLVATVLRQTPSDAHPLRHLRLKTVKVEQNRTYDVTHDVQYELTAAEAAELRSKLPETLQAKPFFGSDLPAAFLAHLKETLE